jgi:hypothetical protein
MILSERLHVLQMLPRYRSAAHDPPAPDRRGPGLPASLRQINTPGRVVSTGLLRLTRDHLARDRD